ncbi:CPBP family intramembrane glutamic endopeptidase [Marisediminicola sp. LYQ85]|uniref:CPBP family intramembrane glutamic endopeptidase n=1 Tax=Marisediminicola sp. LYQ85 TaxID=3391062 RepID=UPI0039838FE0
MIDPAWPGAPWTLGALLAGLLALLVARAIKRDRRDYRRFTRFRSTRRRVRAMRRWLLDSLLTFGGASVVVLAFVWQYVPLLLDEVDGVWWVASARSWWESTGGLLDVVAWSVAAVVLVGGTLVLFLARSVDTVPTIGDIHTLLPRNRRELPYGAALSVNAGIVEELLFRLALPAIVFGVTGSALVAIVASVAVFGALHAYQGVAGVVGSTVIGAALMALYLATGSILLPIVAHALIDVRSLVLIPVIVYGVHREPSTRSTPSPPRVR